MTLRAIAAVSADLHQAATASTGTSGAQPSPALEPHGQNDRARHAQSRAFVLVQPRLVGIEGAAGVLGVGTDVVKGLIESGAIVPVRVPRPQTLREHKRGARSAEIRRTLIDVADLNALVDAWKAGG